MKQYLNREQTAKLIELGFEKPMWRVARKFDDQPPRKIITSFGELRTASYEDVYAYSIGELIEMLPKSILHPHNTSLRFYLAISFLQSEQWYVDYETCDSALYSVAKSELIDALYDMILKLKEEEIIQ